MKKRIFVVHENPNFETGKKYSINSFYYSRQLPLWGTFGQRELENAHICIIAKDTVMLQEILQILISTGVPKFTWYYPKPEDIDSSDWEVFLSFYLKNTMEFIDSWRLSKGVEIERRDWPEEDPKSTDWEIYSAIIQIGPYFLPSDVEYETSYRINTKLPPIIKTYRRGVYGYIFTKLSSPHFILHTHPDNAVLNLGFRHPSAELRSYMRSVPPSYYEVPYVVLLFEALQRVLRKRAKTDPINAKAIRDELEKWYIGEINPRGMHDKNYKEALQFSHQAIRGYTDVNDENNKNGDPSAAQDVIEKKASLCATLYVKTFKQPKNLNDKLAVLMYFLGLFKAINYGRSIVSRDIPDVGSDFTLHSELEKLYRDWFEQDYSSMLSMVKRRPLGASIEDSLVREFCEDAGSLGMIEPTTKTISRDLYKEGQFPDYPLLEALLSYERDIDPTGEDSTSSKLSPEEKEGFNDNETALLVKYFMAGLIANEAIKLITHQFIPADNILICNFVEYSVFTFAYR